MTKIKLDVLNDFYAYCNAVETHGNLFAQVQVKTEGFTMTDFLPIVVLRDHELIGEGSAMTEIGISIPETYDHLGMELKRVPLSEVQAVLTRDEVYESECFMDADQELLDNAY